MSGHLRFLRPAVRCPECGAPPRLRVPAEALELFADLDPKRVALTYQCHIRACSKVYPILVGDLQGAA